MDFELHDKNSFGDNSIHVIDLPGDGTGNSILSHESCLKLRILYQIQFQHFQQIKRRFTTITPRGLQRTTSGVQHRKT